MIKKILNYTLATLSIIAFIFGETIIYFLANINSNRTTFEIIFMPLMAIGKFSLPLFIIGLFVLNVKNGSYVVGILFLVIGSTVMISGFDSYETWRILLEENADDQRFQGNFSKQLPHHTFSIIEGILILSAGMYFTIQYLRKRKWTRMKTRCKIIIIVGFIIIGFVIWSSDDTVCRSPISGNIIHDGELTFLTCIPEPLWYDWLKVMINEN